MNFKNFKQTTIPVGLMFGLIATQQPFVLIAPDGSVAGHGTIVEESNSVALVKVTAQGNEFTGTGLVRDAVNEYRQKKQAQGVRSDRAFSQSLSLKYKKIAQVYLTSSNGEKVMACELKISRSEIDGLCLNPVNQQKLTIKTSSE